MKLEFPYQIVTFLGKEPEINEPVYDGANGWYPQVALKRRFRLQDIDGSQLIQLLQPLVSNLSEHRIVTGSLVKPDTMPVRVVDIENQNELKSLHKQILTRLNGDVVSRYPDREGENYYAHITVEFNDDLVLNPEDYTNKQFMLENLWIIKDVGDENSLAYIKIK